MDNGWLFGMTMLAEVVARVGDSDLAEALVRARLLPYDELVGTRRRGDREWVDPPPARAARIAPRAHTMTRSRTSRRRRRCIAPIGADIWITHTDVDEAVARLRRGTRTTTVTRRSPRSMQAAGEVERATRVGGLPSRAEQLLEEARPASALPGGLTRREVEVARLVARGRSNRDIADDVRAVRAHRREPRAAHPHEAVVHLARGDRGLGGAYGARRQYVDDPSETDQYRVRYCPRWREIGAPACSTYTVKPGGIQ